MNPPRSVDKIRLKLLFLHGNNFITRQIMNKRKLNSNESYTSYDKMKTLVHATVEENEIFF